jgi:hypothetical protein
VSALPGRQLDDPHPFIDDAIDLGGVEGIELPSTLALPLRSHLRSARDRRFEDRLDLGPSDDLAADVADDPTDPAAQQAQLAMVALELLGMGIARSHHRRAPGNAQIRLPEPDLASRRRGLNCNSGPASFEALLRMRECRAGGSAPPSR